MTAEDFETPASPALSSGDAGQDGADAEPSRSLAPAPGGNDPRPTPRGTASPSRRPPVRGGLASDAPSPSQTPDPRGGRDGEGNAPDRGAAEGSAPRSGLDPASGGNAVPALAGQNWRDAVNAEKSQQAKDRRNQRGRRKAAGTAVPARPGMARRMPEKPGGAV